MRRVYPLLKASDSFQSDPTHSTPEYSNAPPPAIHISPKKEHVIDLDLISFTSTAGSEDQFTNKSSLDLVSCIDSIDLRSLSRISSPSLNDSFEHVDSAEIQTWQRPSK